VELVGIGVDPDRRGRGIGSSLLQRFETEAKALGVEEITVGSAGGDVDRFYVNHGYSPESILVRATPETHPSDVGDLGYEVVEERRQRDGSVKFYLAVEDRDPSELQTVRDRFGDGEAIYIMQKTIAEG
jgi:ribosomal protein S18 acetylase RimI-like enzyme